MNDKLSLLKTFHNNYWVKYKIGAALIAQGEVHSMVSTRLDGLRYLFEVSGFPYSALAKSFFDNHSHTLKRGLIEIGLMSGSVEERVLLMANIEQQLIDRIAQYADDGISESMACEAIIKTISLCPNSEVKLS